MHPSTALRAAVAALVMTAATLSLVSAPPAPVLSQADHDGIKAAALDYAMGWYEGDGERMSRALHPMLAKRRVVVSAADGTRSVQDMTAEQLVAMTARGGGSRTPVDQRLAEVEILDAMSNSATVRVEMAGWVDYLHVARVDEGWRIVNVLWELKEGG